MKYIIALLITLALFTSQAALDTIGNTANLDVASINTPQLQRALADCSGLAEAYTTKIPPRYLHDPLELLYAPLS